MDLSEILQGSHGIQAIARELNISPDDAKRGATALLPSVLQGFGQRAQAGAGAGAAGGLEAILSALGGGNLAANVTNPEPTQVDKGNEILGHIFGSKDVSRQVAGNAAQGSGVDADVLKKMLPIVAMLAGGYLSSRSQPAQGGIGGLLGAALSGLGGNQAGAAPGGGLGSLLGGLFGNKT